ncbi:MAG: tetraacyldisaccharide 4'-kinase [Halieaceae bacterium]|jgi:tetraacyldisaccharide 4'-kinase|nr:tetraacyldisaccharide 4'-kinase [Halieaceae bacterium]
MADWQSALAEAWYRRALWLWLLRPLEVLFRSLAALRRGLYRIGLLSRFHAPKPVVVVGNITVGGTGKTPIVVALVEYLQSEGFRPAVVSRGYGATGESFPHTVTTHSTAADCGDEPLLIFQRTDCPCVVAPSRVAAVEQLLASFDVDIIICDDGLQHYALDRDMEIAVLDKHWRVGNGFCLPAGPLREPLGRLALVDHVLYRGSDDPANGVTYEQACLINLDSGEERVIAPDSLAKNIHALAGIGQPNQFFESLRQRGFSIEAHQFPDHHDYTPTDFSNLTGKPVIMTEKDAVKCRAFTDSNAWYLKINARIPDAVQRAVVSLVKLPNGA